MEIESARLAYLFFEEIFFKKKGQGPASLTIPHLSN